MRNIKLRIFLFIPGKSAASTLEYVKKKICFHNIGSSFKYLECIIEVFLFL